LAYFVWCTLPLLIVILRQPILLLGSLLLHVSLLLPMQHPKKYAPVTAERLMCPTSKNIIYVK
jgi:hypothetical protein